MQPTFRILADSKDVTAAIADRLISLSITDEAGFASDEITLRIDDRDDKVALPRTGAELEVFLGYVKQGLVRMGMYTVDEIGHDGPPAVMTIRAKAANMRQSMKSRKTRSWNSTTLGKIVETIASEHDYTATVSADLAILAIDHVDQAEESDLHFLTRLAKERDAVFKPAAGYFVVAPRGESKSVSGKTLTPVAISGEQVNTWSMKAASRGKYQAVTANYHDAGQADRIDVTVGEGDPAFKLPFTYPNKEQAEGAAKGKLAALERGTATLDLTVVGNPALAAESMMSLSGVNSKVNGDWSVIRVDHRLEGQGGYSCNISSETPTGNPKPILD
jgi:phage protein D